MFTSGVIRSLRDASQAEQTATRLGRELMTGQKVETAADDPAVWLSARRGQSSAALLDTIHTGLSDAATNIQIADTTMQAIGEHLKTMQGVLQQALEYPPGDPARLQAITNFNNILPQIDSLVGTTPQAGARDLMSGGDINVMVGLDGEAKTVHAQPVDSASLGVAPLAVDASETDIRAALVDLTTAQNTLTTKRQGLAAEASDVNRYQTNSAQGSAFYQSQAESLTSADSTEAAVALQSVNVQRSLAMETLAGIGTMRSAVLELLQ
jgi:flagellin